MFVLRLKFIKTPVLSVCTYATRAFCYSCTFLCHRVRFSRVRSVEFTELLTLGCFLTFKEVYAITSQEIRRYCGKLLLTCELASIWSDSESVRDTERACEGR